MVIFSVRNNPGNEIMLSIGNHFANMYPGIRIASRASDAMAPAAIPLNNLFVNRGNFERESIPIANIMITDGIIATSLNVAYGIMPSGGSNSKLADAPLRIIISIVNPNSDLFF